MHASFASLVPISANIYPVLDELDVFLCSEVNSVCSRLATTTTLSTLVHYGEILMQQIFAQVLKLSRRASFKYATM